MTDQRLLLVHAHPDDEVITTGGTMAKHAAAGDQVTLVTCTLGEEGEILLPEISHLAADQQDGLADLRREELADAMEALGIRDSRILGGPGTYRDSGMMGTAANDRPDVFWQADLREAADHLVPVIRELRPQVLVTYDDFGNYGHPDHIQAHRVAMYASQLAAARSYRPDFGPDWDIDRIFWTAFPSSAVRAGIEALRAMGDDSEFARMDPDEAAMGVPDELVDVAVDVSDYLGHKVAAMRAHPSQINMEEGFFALSNNLDTPVFGEEYFRQVKGVPAATSGHRADDLFAGLAG